MIHRHDPLWGSHIPVLIEALRQTRGAVLELGLGISSTPLLHMLCADAGRRLISYEHEPQFVDMFKKYRGPMHEITLIEEWDDADMSRYPWGVILVDHKPDERRFVDIIRLKDAADFLVVHDTEPESDAIFKYTNVYPLFKYRFDYTKFKTHTTVLGNVKEFIWPPYHS